ncbi:hypothetical protein [Mucilaginibacter sp. HD30]
MTEVIFTICAKNYLSQALALKASLLETNPEKDFVIFVSDTQSGIEDVDVIFPHESWISDWQKMAFKYNVIEYSTAIKPFCINLLKEKYDKIIFVDPDTYATHSFDYIFQCLDSADIMITPHINNIQEVFTGAVSEEEILFVGICNLGFLAVKKSETLNKMIKWWMKRLHDKCYADKFDALHVDQKWFDFIPAFFPDKVHISHHCGINTAIWNLHERDLLLKDGKYFVKNVDTDETYPLIFFHFSGFNPNNPTLINRRHPKYSLKTFPSFELLFNKYTKLLFESGYDRFITLQYGYNTFNDFEKITPLHRRLFREIEKVIECKNPFDINDSFYQIMKDDKLLTNTKISISFNSNPNIIRTRDKEIQKGILFLKFLKKLIGIKFYNYILVFFTEYHRLERQTFLISKKNIDKFKRQ